jgi:hypothetical protein
MGKRMMTENHNKKLKNKIPAAKIDDSKVSKT